MFNMSMFGQDAVNATSLLSENTSYDFLGLPFFHGPSLLELFIRFSFNTLICWIIIQFFYYKKSNRRDFYFTFLMFSVTVFLLIFLLDNVKLQLGFALGLFAIFGMIRYRTETVPIREMTYLFIIIGISVINGLAMTKSYLELIVTNLIFVVFILLLENTRLFKQTACKIILYDKIQLIMPDREADLMADLRQRTGLNILKIEVGNIDFLRDIAYIKIFYAPTGDHTTNNVLANEVKPPEF